MKSGTTLTLIMKPYLKIMQTFKNVKSFFGKSAIFRMKVKRYLTNKI